MRSDFRFMLATLLWFADAGNAQTTQAVVATDPQAVKANLQKALQDLPEGPGKVLTAVACTRCHNLAGLTAYNGYWNRVQWLAMVENMVKHGAALDASQITAVTDYLNDTYGRRSLQSQQTP